MQKILVTGATGFIGRYVVADLHQRGISVIETSTGGNEDSKRFDLNQFDANINYWEFFGKPDKIIHLAQ